MSEHKYKENDEEMGIQTKVSVANIAAMKKVGKSMEVKKMEELMNPRMEFLVKCQFNQKHCNLERDVEAQFQSQFGVCFSFNTVGATKHKMNQFSVQDGLKLLISTMIGDSLLTTFSGGIKILVHDSDEYPFVDSFGLFIPAGSHSILHIDLNQISRSSLGSRKCTDEPVEKYNYYRERKYSYEGCTRSFLQERMNQLCGCSNPDFADDFLRANFTACSAHDPCMLRMADHIDEIMKENPCTMECRKTQFKTEMSFSILRSDFNQTNPGSDASSTIRLELNMRPLSILAIRERAAMQLEDIFWSFCQIIGLCFGISAIELFALLTKLVELFITIVKMISKRGKRKDEENEIATC